MKDIFTSIAFLIGLLLATPSWAGLFSSGACDSASKESMPDWVSNSDYNLPGYQIGVGWAEREGKNKDEQREAAEANAKMYLVQRIKVTISAVVVQGTNVSNERVQKTASSKITSSSEQELRGMQIKQHWVNKENCRDYVLVTISDSAVYFNKFKALLADGKDSDKNGDVRARKGFLDDAKALLPLIDFKKLPGELKASYEKQLEEAFAANNKELSKVKGRMAVFPMSKDGVISQNILDKAAGKLLASNATLVRLNANCASADECIGKAREMDFTALTLLEINAQVGVTTMGSYKGTIKITRTIYDTDSPKMPKSKNVGTAVVIGWSDDDLDWGTATEKAMEGWK
ncbi:MAG: LPP20 family lipoprotein [Gallionellaceae bacterium]